MGAPFGFKDHVSVIRMVRRYSGGVYDLGLHVVWCPRYRRRVLGGGSRSGSRELIVQRASGKGWEIVAVEVMRGHVHLFVKHEAKASASYGCEPVHRFHLPGVAGGVAAPAVTDP
jgi:putative transposase